MLIPDLIPSSCLYMSCKRILHDICKQYSAGHRFTSLFRRILDWRIFFAVSAVVVVPPYPWRCVQCSKALSGKGKRNFLLIISMHTLPPPTPPHLTHTPDQEKILALFASCSFQRKHTAKRGKFSIEKVLSITKNRL